MPGPGPGSFPHDVSWWVVWRPFPPAGTSCGTTSLHRESPSNWLCVMLTPLPRLQAHPGLLLRSYLTLPSETGVVSPLGQGPLRWLKLEPQENSASLFHQKLEGLAALVLSWKEALTRLLSQRFSGKSQATRAIFPQELYHSALHYSPRVSSLGLRKENPVSCLCRWAGREKNPSSLDSLNSVSWSPISYGQEWVTDCGTCT